MTSNTSICACLGPAGDCPCIRRAKGLPVPITETYISTDIFACLPEEDQRKINELKHKAFGLWMNKKNQHVGENEQAANPSPQGAQ
jgi:hypothetical protein